MPHHDRAATPTTDCSYRSVPGEGGSTSLTGTAGADRQDRHSGTGHGAAPAGRPGDGRGRTRPAARRAGGRRAGRPLARLVAGVGLAVVLAGCAGDDGEQPAATVTTEASTTSEAPTTSAPGTSGTSGPTTTVPGQGTQLGPLETVAAGLEVPWAVAFVDAETILVTERPGRVRVVAGGSLQPEPLTEVGVRAEGEGGLLGIALHPEFPTERFAYLYYSASEENRVVRHRLAEDLSFGPEEVILEGIPRGRFHDGGALAFGPDGMLYITTGDATEPRSAPDLGSLAGKVLRVRPDGSVPDDNPFDGSPVWSYGHRNPQGLTWDAAGHLYATEHGPTGDVADLCCHDELNLIQPGGFYGWPFRAGRVRGAEGSPPAEPIEPIEASGEDTWAPAGIAVLRGGGQGHLLVATLAGEELLRFVVDAEDPAAITATEVALDGEGRLRAADVGPDGCLYLTTSNTDGRGQPGPDDDRLLRTCPTG